MGQAAEEAKRYLQDKEVPTLFESLMTGLMYNRPDDPVEFMLAALLKLKQKDSTKVSWDMFIEAPPPPVDSAVLHSLVGKENMPSGPASEEGRASKKSRQGSPDKKRRDSDSKGKAGKKSTPSTAGSTSSKSTKGRPKTPHEEFQERISTPLLHVTKTKIPSTPLVVMFGGPGGEKTKICEKVGESLADERVVHISMPTLVKTAFEKYGEEYPEWRQAKAMYDRGELLPNEVMLALLKQEMNRHQDAKGFLLEGYPRVEAQVRELEKEGGQVEMAIILDYDEESLESHMRRRGLSSAVVRKRLDEFKEKTLPAAKYYDDKFLLHLVPGEQDDAAIAEDVRGLVNSIVNPGSGADGIEAAGEASNTTKPSGSNDVPLLIVMGAPGSRKTDYCKRIVQRYDGFVHISMGEILRQKVNADPENPVWKKIKEDMQKGELISKEVSAPIIVDEMKKHPTSWGFVIEGYPRDLGQAKDLDEKVERTDLVLLIDCTEQYCIANLEARAGSVDARIDDNPDAIKQRLSLFKQRTLPMLKYYDERGKLKVVRSKPRVRASRTRLSWSMV